MMWPTKETSYLLFNGKRSSTFNDITVNIHFYHYYLKFETSCVIILLSCVIIKIKKGKKRKKEMGGWLYDGGGREGGGCLFKKYHRTHILCGNKKIMKLRTKIDNYFFRIILKWSKKVKVREEKINASKQLIFCLKYPTLVIYQFWLGFILFIVPGQ